MTILKKGSAVLIAVMIAISMMTVGITSVSAAGQTSIVLKHDDEYPYTDGWARTLIRMSADGKMVYCIQPDLPAPANGTYRTDNGKLTEITSSNIKYTMYRKALYYCYGGGGFEVENIAFKTNAAKHKVVYSQNTPSALMGNLKWNSLGTVYNTSLTGSKLHYMYTHLVMSYIYYGDSKYKEIMVNFAPYSGYYDEIKELYNAIKAAANPPITTKLYMLNIGSDKQQVIIQRTGVKLQMQKTSANPSLTNGNNCYSLEGAKYNIYLDKACTDYFGYITTNANGYGKYGAGTNGVDVPEQKYYAKEVEAPKGFALDTKVYALTDSGKTADDSKIMSFSCKDEPGNDPLGITLKKVDAKTGETTTRLKDAEFTVCYYDDYYNTEDELADKLYVRKWVIKTDSNGRTYLNDYYLVSGNDFYYNGDDPNPCLPYGTITIQESKAPDGYQLDETLYIRQITKDGSVYINTTNIADDGALIIDEQEATPEVGYAAVHKTDEETGANVKGAVYGLYSSNETDENGNLLDKYKLATVTTASSGRGTFNQSLDPGTYFVQEITPPAKYVREMKIYDLTITAATTADAAVMVEATDKQTLTEITKTDITGSKELVGAELNVVDVNNKVVDTWTSDGTAHIIRGLIKGRTYTLTETISPDGYATSESVAFTVNEDGSTTKVSMKDDTIKYEFLKTDESNNALSGAVLQLFDSENTKIDEWTTSTSPYKIYGKLVVGKEYRLHEKSAPADKYALAKDITFTVSDTTEVQTITMVDKLAVGSVTLHKEDGSGNELVGAEFKLYKSDGTAVKCIVSDSGFEGEYEQSDNGTEIILQTDEDGLLYVTNLIYGDYYFEETKAPEGMMPHGSKINFTISKALSDNSITVKDNKITTFVTGSVGVTPIYIIGFGSLAAALAVVYFNKKRHRKSK